MSFIVKQFLTKLLNPQNLIYLAFISVFLHYAITSVVIIVLGLCLLLNKNSFKKVFSFNGKVFYIAFFAFTLIVALINKNYLGAICSCAFFFLIAISYYTRSVITEKTFENCLDICCFAAIPLGVGAAIEKLLCYPGGEGSPFGWFFGTTYRSQLWFFNPNYFCSIMAAIIIICAFKATAHKRDVFIYYLCAAFAAIGLYLGGSLFAIVEVFVGLCILLILRRKHLFLAVFLFAVGLSIILIFFIPNLLPRLSESAHTTDLRVAIWDDALNLIKQNPLFGKGFLTYYYEFINNPGTLYETTHAHNFLLEGLLSFGVIGSILLLLLVWSFFEKISECKELLRTNCATTLILTMSAAMLIHTTTDLTIMWVQTGLLYMLIFGGVGIDEKALRKRLLACVQKKDQPTDTKTEN